MATRKYETMFILKPTLNEEEVNAKVELVKTTLEKQGATIEAVEMMGSRQIAFKIDKFERGIYGIVYFQAEGSAIKEMERIYRITEDVLRHNFVKYEKTVELKAWDNMVKKAKGLPFEEKRLASTSRERAPRGNYQAKKYDRVRDNKPEFQKPRETPVPAAVEKPTAQ